MNATVADLNPKTLDSAKRQFVELYGSALVLNTYLKIALVLVSLVALGLVGLNFHTAAKYSQIKPLVIRIDDDGRANPAVAPNPGVGLLGMRERVTALGGTLDAAPRSGGGFTVQAELPVAQP